jgi:hypothetical protein
LTHKSYFCKLFISNYYVAIKKTNLKYKAPKFKQNYLYSLIHLKNFKNKTFIRISNTPTTFNFRLTNLEPRVVLSLTTTAKQLQQQQQTAAAKTLPRAKYPEKIEKSN